MLMRASGEIQFLFTFHTYKSVIQYTHTHTCIGKHTHTEQVDQYTHTHREKYTDNLKQSDMDTKCEVIILGDKNL